MEGQDYRCDGCGLPITPQDGRVLTGILDGQPVFYHTNFRIERARSPYHAIAVVVAVMGARVDRETVSCSGNCPTDVKDRRTIRFSEFERLVKQQAALQPK